MKTLLSKRSLLRSISLLLVLLLANIVDVYGQSVEQLNGVWTGGDAGAFYSVEFNSNRTESLNPNNYESECDGYMSVYAISDTGGRSFLSSYEFYVDEGTGEALILRYNVGRPGIDGNAEGKCNVTITDGTLVFSVIESSGDTPLFKGVAFSKDGSTVVINEEVATGRREKSVWDYIPGILVLIIYAGYVGHMIYVYFKGPRYKKIFTVDDMKVARVMSGKSETMSDEEEAEVIDLLDRVFDTWTVVEPDEFGNEMRKPTKIKQIRNSVDLLNGVIALQPTSEEWVNRINELTDVINSNEKRYFNGSKKLVWVGVLVGAAFCFIMLQMGIIILVSTAAYLLASRAPAFLIDKQAERGFGNVHNGIITGIFAMIAGARTIRTVTKYGDGSKDVEDDHSEHWIALFISLILFVLIAYLMSVWAFINYLRNYVFYV